MTDMLSTIYNFILPPLLMPILFALFPGGGNNENIRIISYAFIVVIGLPIITLFLLAVVFGVSVKIFRAIAK
jgi:hypothetical protein